MEQTSAAAPRTEVTRYYHLPLPLKVICCVFWATGLLFFVWYMWGWTPGGFVLEDIQYFYILYLTFSTCVFLCLPMRKLQLVLELSQSAGKEVVRAL